MCVCPGLQGLTQPLLHHDLLAIMDVKAVGGSSNAAPLEVEEGSGIVGIADAIYGRGIRLPKTNATC